MESDTMNIYDKENSEDIVPNNILWLLVKLVRRTSVHITVLHSATIKSKLNF